MTFIKRSVLLMAIIIAAVTVGRAQQPPAKTAKAPAQPTGKEMFKTYCASCHGDDAKGNGPVAPALKQPPPDLTQLAKQNKGEFPTDDVTNVLLHGVNVPAHGTSQMPVWGPVFIELNDRGVQRLRITSLVQYLKSIQAK